MLVVGGEEQLSGGIILRCVPVLLWCSALPAAFSAVQSILALSANFPWHSSSFHPSHRHGVRFCPHWASTLRVTRVHGGKQVCGISQGDIWCSIPPATSVGLDYVHQQQQGTAASMKP